MKSLSQLLLAAAVALFSFAGCGGGGGGGGGSVPNAPANVTITAGGGQNTLSWDEVSGATSYNIYWKNSAGVTTSDAKIEGATSPYIHTGLTNGTTYYYAITALNAVGEGALSSEVSATPEPPIPGVPQNPSATAGYESVTVGWDTVSGASSYNIYWANSSGVTKATGTKIAGVTSPYLDTPLTGGTAYYYVVTAVNGGGESAESAQVSATAKYPLLKVFVTSATGKGNLHAWSISGWSPPDTGITAADEICTKLAGDAHLRGNFKAWISDDSNDAYCRVHNVSGAKGGCSVTGITAGPWVRMDGFPFGEEVEQLLDPNYKAYAPPWYDENGTLVNVSDTIFTDTNSAGQVDDAAPCDNWTNSAAGGNITFGYVDATGSYWSVGAGGIWCNQDSHLICFQTGPGSPITITPSTGKKAFVTSASGTGNLHSWNIGGWSPPDTEITAGDEICQKLATDASFSGTFKAWLSYTGNNAKDHVGAGPWVRLDGVRVANSKAEMISSQKLLAPINVTEAGAYITGVSAWTGTDAYGNDTTTNCSDWTIGDGTKNGVFGFPERASGEWTDDTGTGCGNTNQLYCFED